MTSPIVTGVSRPTQVGTPSVRGHVYWEDPPESTPNRSTLKGVFHGHLVRPSYREVSVTGYPIVDLITINVRVLFCDCRDIFILRTEERVRGLEYEDWVEVRDSSFHDLYLLPKLNTYSNFKSLLVLTRSVLNKPLTKQLCLTDSLILQSASGVLQDEGPSLQLVPCRPTSTTLFVLTKDKYEGHSTLRSVLNRTHFI